MVTVTLRTCPTVLGTRTGLYGNSRQQCDDLMARCGRLGWVRQAAIQHLAPCHDRAADFWMDITQACHEGLRGRPKLDSEFLGDHLFINKESYGGLFTTWCISRAVSPRLWICDQCWHDKEPLSQIGGRGGIFTE